MRRIYRAKALSISVLLGLLTAIAALPAAAADILGASYDAIRDEIVVDIVYLGTNPKHHFSVQWGRCYDVGGPPRGAAARLVDDQWNDHAVAEYRVRERLSLQGLECRPARVTLRLGRTAHENVFVPARPAESRSSGEAHTRER